MKPKSLFFAFSPFIISQVTTGHGLIEHPPSRNQICGVETKPHEVGNGGGLTPECAEAFETDWNGGYQFMSVLTHDYGRQVVKTTTNVCGFDSETWQGGATPWDTAMDWPTTPLSSGTQEFVWNISWGPHFDDTEEFVYYITKPDFVFDPTQPLSWDDFEDEPFCHENFVYSQPNNNPKVVPRLDLVKFYTYCDVPARSGRHVIYGEWGRNYFTFERFHGCVDVIFDGPANPQTPVPVPPSPTDMPIIPTMAPVPSGGAVPTAVPASGGNPTGYCNWNNCNGIEEGGSYCNQDESYCGQCGGTWCPNGSSPTSPPAPTFPGGPGYCNWNNCNGVVEGGEYCNESEERCLSCGGNVSWCPTGEPAPAVNPMNSPVAAPPGYCNWNNCDGFPQGGSWCNANESRCQQCGNGATWCT